MLILQVVTTSILSMVLLFVMTKLTGDKQISQMSAFDYIVGITIGSAATEMAIGGEVFLPAAVTTVVYGVAAFLISYICNKSIRARYFLNGNPVVLYKDGVFYRKNMSRVRMDMEELLTQCRTNGDFFLSDISCIIMEQNGKVSVLKKGEGKLGVNVVVDARILEKNLESIGKSKGWLNRELKKREVDLKRVMLATVTDGRLDIYTFTEKDEKNDLFK